MCLAGGPASSVCRVNDEKLCKFDRTLKPVFPSVVAKVWPAPFDKLPLKTISNLNGDIFNACSILTVLHSGADIVSQIVSISHSWEVTVKAFFGFQIQHARSAPRRIFLGRKSVKLSYCYLGIAKLGTTRHTRLRAPDSNALRSTSR